ncbi:hypothetical protein ACMGE9_13035 [Macrococcus sp. EM39E]|uniref:hypothetical protein n=1 Tax=Macrococcus animalis TaxID=3395467 RepID=UPI0039BEBBDA
MKHDSISPETNLPSVKEFIKNQNSCNNNDQVTVKIKINRKALRICNSTILDFNNINWIDSNWGALEFILPKEEVPFLVSQLTIYGDNIKILSPIYIIDQLMQHIDFIKELYR